MKFSSLLILCLLLASAGMAQPVKWHGRLKVVGTRLMDEHGQPYGLRGMSLGWSCWWPRF